MAHTPIPLPVVTEEYISPPKNYIIRDAEGSRLTVPTHDKDRTIFIATAVNNHNKLVTVIDWLIEDLEHHLWKSTSSIRGCGAIRAARDILTAIEKEV